MHTKNVSYGAVDQWASQFPSSLVPIIVELILEIWPRCLAKYKFTSSDFETRITRRLEFLLIQEKKVRKLPLRIQREIPEEIEENGDVEEKGRIDLNFTHGFDEEVYFAFECKRLNVYFQDSRHSLAGEYVGKDGLMAYISEWYAQGLIQAGMIGYVMDGDVKFAVAQVNKIILEKKDTLRTDAGLKESSIFPDNNNIKETSHALSQRTMIIHHLFLSL